MTIGQFLTAATSTLKQAGDESARLDCLILLEDALGLDRAQLLAHPERELDAAHLADLHTNVMQREQHIPLAYIRGKALFYSREFIVNRDVLVPRPETESIIELLRALPLPPAPRIADIGAGSGCLGITAALEIPGATVLLRDISTAALDVAARNAQRLAVHVRTQPGNLLESIDEPFDVLLANLPYVPETYQINAAAQHEPRLAIFAGTDGLDLFRRFWQQIGERKQQPRFILAESLPAQHDALRALAVSANYQLQETQGFAQQFIPIS